MALACDEISSVIMTPGHQPVLLREVLVHMVEEYARHAGHADLIRQSLDGATDV